MSASPPKTVRRRAARVRIGIGSWTDAAYTGVLFPGGVPAEERLSVYATRFDHVEVNASYYATPRIEAVREWVRRTPDGFTFDVKLHRVFAQSPAKAGAGDFLPRFLGALEPLIAADRLGALLLVLPPSFSPSRHQLDELDALAAELRGYPLAIELRDAGWVKGAQRAATFSYFRERKLVWVAVDMPAIAGSDLMPAVDEVTNPQLAYLRLHGRNKGWRRGKTAAEKHAYRYTDADLAAISKRIRKLGAAAREVHVFANNHAEDFAPRAALRLKELLPASRARRR